MDLVIPLIIGVIFWLLIFAKYKSSDFKVWGNKKPRLDFFPKYTAKFESSHTEFVEKLNYLGFKVDDKRPNVYFRGKIYGDFVASKILLNVELDPETKSFNLYSPGFILFDTGDLWLITKNLVQSET
jgi:hypothetical protein